MYLTTKDTHLGYEFAFSFHSVLANTTIYKQISTS